MKRFLCTLTLLALLTPSVAEGRWIGEYARDYSDRLVKQSRGVREGAADLREAARKRRVNARRQSRGRRAPQDTRWQNNFQLSPSARSLQQRKELKTIRIDEWLRRRGQRRAHTAEEKKQHVASRLELRLEKRRKGDLRELYSLLQWYAVSGKPEHTKLLPTSSTEICQPNAASCSGLWNVIPILILENKRSVPVDPAVEAGENGTGYFVQKAGSGLILTAPNSTSSGGIMLDSSTLFAQ